MSKSNQLPIPQSYARNGEMDGVSAVREGLENHIVQISRARDTLTCSGDALTAQLEVGNFFFFFFFFFLHANSNVNPALQ